MRWKVSGCGLVLLAALALGVGGAGGRAAATATVVVQVLGDGKVTGLPTGDCGQGSLTCYFTTSSSSSSSITLTASPSISFTSWLGSDDCPGTGSGATCTFTLSPGGDKEEFAHFGSSPATSTLTVDVTGDSDNKGGNVSGGNGEIDCDPGDTGAACAWDVPPGSTVTVVADPETGYDFTGWGGACSGNAVSCTVSIGSSDAAVHATFAKSAATQTLTVAVTGRGTVTGGGIACTSAGGSGCTASETTGSTVTLTAIPDSGAGFLGWGGSCSGSASTCTLTMNSARSATASFSGAGTSSVPLTVSVTGSGTVTGGGINCGGGATACTANLAVGSSVTLTASPGSGSTFEAWGGACSGAGETCTLTMSAARNVTATFTASTAPGATTTNLTLTVTGRGTVSASGGACASSGPPRTCSEPYAKGTKVELTAVPAPGARFLRWGGACSGTARTCTVTLDAAKTVTASFSGAVAPAAQAVLRARGRAIVGRTETGFEVTLRFVSTQRGHVRLRGIRAGRLETALAFTVAPGAATIGPFPIAKPGFYKFELKLGRNVLHWGVCLGRCGKDAPGYPFTLTRELPDVVHAGAAWSITVHVRATNPAGLELRIYRGKALVKLYRFVSGAGAVSAGPFVLSPGTYRFRLTAIDAYGRTQALGWYAFLP